MTPMTKENVMNRKVVPLTSEQFALLCVGGWEMNDLPREVWPSIPGLHRLHDAFAVMASGCVSRPHLMHGVPAVAGIDVLCHEPNPKWWKNEPEGNAYHHRVTKSGRPDFPYLLRYDYDKGTVAPHWFTAGDLHVYDGAKVIQLNDPLR